MSCSPAKCLTSFPACLHEAVRTIQQVDPAQLSVVNRMYRGDIETIVAKALEKDKSRRYASPADLAADIQRYLEDQPITAKPASASYQLQKFARRHKGSGSRHSVGRSGSITRHGGDDLGGGAGAAPVSDRASGQRLFAERSAGPGPAPTARPKQILISRYAPRSTAPRRTYRASLQSS